MLTYACPAYVLDQELNREIVREMIEDSNLSYYSYESENENDSVGFPASSASNYSDH